ncbi:MAG TPA: tubulin-like doman-containing protein [Pyrinomonadaceae bacterium]|jgi:hypothetical protein
MPDNGVFIGLGGAGVTTTAHLKAKLLRAAGSREKLREHARFIFIDTATRHIERLNNQYRKEFSNESIITPEEHVNLGNVNPWEIFTSAQEDIKNGRIDQHNQHLINFVDPKSANDFNPRPLDEGASANRQQGRVAIWDRRLEIQNKIMQAVLDLKNIANEEANAHPIPFYILSGTVGGTGSSAFLDVAYILDREVKKQSPGWGDPKIRAVLFMPQWYIQQYQAKPAPQHIIENYQSNGAAFFDEQSYFLADYYSGVGDGRGEKFSAVCVDPAIDRELGPNHRRWKLFDFAVCVDGTTEHGATLTDEQMYVNTAELLFYWHQGYAQGGMVEQFDNVLAEAYRASQNGLTPAFVTMGYRALQFPELLMREYFRRRFLYEFFYYGLVGAAYKDALPNEPRREEVGDAFRRSVARYLFESEFEEKVPNLEAARGAAVEAAVRSLSAGRFMKEEHGFLGRIGFGSKEEYDPEKIADAREVTRFVDHARTIIADLRRKMEEEFNDEDAETGRERLLGNVRRGFSAEKNEPSSGSVESFLEDGIMRFGLLYAAGLADALDVEADNKARQLGEERTRVLDQLDQLEGQITSSQNDCLRAKSGEKPRHFADLFNRLRQRIQLAAREVVLSQQIRVLNDLSEGETGVLDNYHHNLDRIYRLVHDRLRGKKDARDTTLDIEASYRRELPKLFSATAEDVTTTYLPDVKSFVRDGQWTDGHLFAQLYGKLIRQDEQPGRNSRPLRHKKDDYGRSADLQGLQSDLRRMLTDKEITRTERGYAAGGEIHFFRNFFSTERAEDPQALVNRLEEYAVAYIDQQMRRSDDINQQVNKPLIERVESLTADEKQKLKEEKFSDAGTQTFCRMSLVGGTPPVTYNLYVGSDPGLAARLGYDAGSRKHQFIPEDTPNRFLKIKANTLYTINRYPYLDQYHKVYTATKDQRRQADKTFAPHIHRLFNEYGVAEGMNMLLKGSKDPVDLFVLSLFYRELFDLAKAEHPALLEEIFYLDEELRGDRLTCHSPLIIESSAGTGTKALVCGKINLAQSKLLLERRDFINVAGFVESHMDIYRGLVNRPQLVDVLHTVDRYFRERCSRTWLLLFDRAATQLGEKLQPDGSELETERDFYTQMGNHFVVLRRELKEVVANKQGGERFLAATGTGTRRPKKF